MKFLDPSREFSRVLERLRVFRGFRGVLGVVRRLLDVGVSERFCGVSRKFNRVIRGGLEGFQDVSVAIRSFRMLRELLGY